MTILVECIVEFRIMRMKNEDLLKLKIEIQTDDDTNFLELAILFDK